MGRPPGGPPSPAIDGFVVRVAEVLRGARNGVRRGSTIFLSPAMWSLIEDAGEDQAALRRILGAIRLISIPDLSMSEMPMTVEPPKKTWSWFQDMPKLG